MRCCWSDHSTAFWLKHEVIPNEAFKLNIVVIETEQVVNGEWMLHEHCCTKQCPPPVQMGIKDSWLLTAHIHRWWNKNHLPQSS